MKESASILHILVFGKYYCLLSSIYSGILFGIYSAILALLGIFMALYLA